MRCTQLVRGLAGPAAAFAIALPGFAQASPQPQIPTVTQTLEVTATRTPEEAPR